MNQLLRHLLYRRRRTAFSLVELLVVIAIVGALGALVLSAVQGAREGARRTGCANHLRQIGLGAQHHYEHLSYFPSAGTNSEDFTLRAANPPEFERLGWGFQLLPYIEQTSLYNAAKGHVPTARLAALDNRCLCEIPVTTYTCPSRGLRTIGDAARDNIEYALGDYAGLLFGFLGDMQWRTAHNDEGAAGRPYRLYGWRGIISKGGHNYKGTYHRWPAVRSDDVSDGLSNTLMLMEKAVWSQRYASSTANSSAMTCEVFGWAHNAHQPTMRSVPGDGGVAFGGISGNWAGSPGRGAAPPIRSDDVPRDGERDWDQGFGSPHPGIVMALWGDGSVRSVSETIDQSMGGTLFRLGCRDDSLTFVGPEQ